MRAVLVQAHIEKGKPEINREHIMNYLDKALKEQPEVIVLPELWNTGYTRDIKKLSDKAGEPTLSLLTSFARKHRINIIGGSIANTIEGKLFNHSYVISRQGEIAANYSKAHLFSLNNEKDYFSPGKSSCLFYLDDIPCGLMICYDLRFPELSWSLALEGAKILFVTAQWPRTRIEAWRFLVGARAVENQVYTVAVNRGGQDGEVSFGGSMAVDPAGNIVAEAGEEETLAVVDVNLKKVAESREKIFYLRDRKPEIYKIIH